MNSDKSVTINCIFSIDSLIQLLYYKIKKEGKTMKNEKVFINELGLDVLELVEALTVDSDRIVAEAIEELKTLKDSKTE
jgi:hypothetical protein